LKELIQK
jgi:hypothetical protein